MALVLLDVRKVEVLVREVMGYTASEAAQQAVDIMKSAGKGNGDAIELEEFCHVCKKGEYFLTDDRYIHALFSVLDVDNSGELDALEVRDIFDRYGARSMIIMVQEIIENGESIITFDDFRSAISDDMSCSGLNDLFQKYDVGLVLRQQDIDAIYYKASSRGQTSSMVEAQRPRASAIGTIGSPRGLIPRKISHDRSSNGLDWSFPLRKRTVELPGALTQYPPPPSDLSTRQLSDGDHFDC